MGNLPSVRITPAKPFESTIVDYAGYFDIKPWSGRGRISVKGYVAVFVCMFTRAVHLEAVGDLSTDKFIGALQRFIACRGHCAHMYSDGGTKFVGAANQLNRTRAEYEHYFDREIQTMITKSKIELHCSPPSSPHFNGLVESNVKSMKTHLTKIFSNVKLTYEEFTTVICRIEAVINSRPLTLISDDPNDYAALTPAHPLRQKSSLSYPEPAGPIVDNPTNRYQLMSKLIQHFWTRWRKEVLSSMQIRLNGRINNKIIFGKYRVK